MRALYHERRAVLVSAVERYLLATDTESDPPARLLAGEGGMHVVLTLPQNISDKHVARACDDAGLSVTPLSSYYRGAEPRMGLVLGFAGFAPTALEVAIQKLVPVIEKVATARHV